jgi:hypothetical protein
MGFMPVPPATVPTSLAARPLETQARASVTIKRAARASSDNWSKVPHQARREISFHDEQGRLIRVRLIEFE